MKKLAVYIHWPFCKAKCPYCDFNSHVREKVEQDRWKNALLRELEYFREYSKDFTVSSVFFGGGTPSLMETKTAAALIEKIHDLWQVADNVEITLEANPTSVEAQKFVEFKAAGVNRLSLGVQSLRDEELKFLGRGHSATEAIEAIKLADKIFERYSFDIIYARPKQNVKDWEAELNEILPLAGGHLSLYQLTIEENTAFYNAYAKGGFEMPDEETAEKLYLFTEEKLARHGLFSYEVSNYARQGQESKHNLSYWQGDSYLGIGPGAHGRIELCHNFTQLTKSEDAISVTDCLPGSPLRAGNKRRIATSNLKSPERWLEKVEREGNGLEVWQEIAPQTEIEERVMMGLRLRDGINYAEFAAATGYDLRGYINLAKRDFYTDQGLLEDDNRRLTATLKGRLLLNELIAELLPDYSD